MTSCGYADDVLIFAESPEALLSMHNWTRAFFGAHAFKLNTKKTKLVATSRAEELSMMLEPRLMGGGCYHCCVHQEVYVHSRWVVRG